MKNSKLYQLLCTFDEHDWRSAVKLLRSPYFNHRADVRRLLEVLRRYAPKGSPTYAGVFEEVFPGQRLDKTRLRHVMSFLVEALEHHLVIEELELEEERPYVLARAYQRRGLRKGLKLALNREEKRLQESGRAGISHLRQSYRLQLLQYEEEKKASREEAFALQQNADTLECLLAAQKLRQCCVLLSHQQVTQQSYDFGFLPGLLEYLHTEKGQCLLKNPAVRAYYLVYQSFQEDHPEKAFDELLVLLRREGGAFSFSELRNLYLFAGNHAIRQINLGRREYMPALYTLYKQGLQGEVWLENGRISTFTYKNIIALGLGERDFDWVEDFLHGYKAFLAPDERENSFNYNFAKLLYARGRHDRALQILNQVKFRDLLPNLTARLLEHKIYYEQGDFDVLESSLHTFERMLRRKRQLSYHKKVYSNWIRLMRQLVNLNRYSRRERESLRQRMQQTSPLPERAWLLEQLEAPFTYI